MALPSCTRPLYLSRRWRGHGPRIKMKPTLPHQDAPPAEDAPPATEPVPQSLPNVEHQAAPSAPGHRRLTDGEKWAIELVRKRRRDFMEMLRGLGMLDSAGRPVSRDAALAVTHMEDAEYRAVRHITGGPA